MVNSVTGSYSYSALCDVCKFKYKASQLQLRWDGFMVCRWDWEPRHPLDFFRGRLDAHKLPWTRSDDGAQGSNTWQPTWTTLTIVDGPVGPMDLEDAVTTPIADFSDWITGTGTALDTRRFNAQVVCPVGASWTTSNPLTVTLPSSPVTAGTFVFKIGDIAGDTIIATGAVPAGSATLTLLSSAAQTFFATARLSGRYGLV